MRRPPAPAETRCSSPSSPDLIPGIRGPLPLPARGERGGEGGKMSESDAHLALKGIGVAPEIGDGEAVTPAIFEAEIDKRHRAPEQIGVGYRQLLVEGGVRVHDDVRVDRIPDPADLQGRPQVLGPPMLVPDPGAI